MQKDEHEHLLLWQIIPLAASLLLLYTKLGKWGVVPQNTHTHCQKNTKHEPVNPIAISVSIIQIFPPVIT